MPRRPALLVQMSLVALAVLGTGLAPACIYIAAPTSDAAGTDVLDFIIGAPGLWPRQGSQWQHQVVNHARREVCWVKYGNSRMFECWRWDDEWIYHDVDHGLDGETGESYEFTRGFWMPRRLSGTWSLDVIDNDIRWFDANCRPDPSRSHRFEYHLRAWIEPARDLGRDLGVREVLTLEYAPGRPGPGGYRERFQFGRGAGWFAWDNGAHLVLFDRFGGPTVGRSAHCSEWRVSVS